MNVRSLGRGVMSLGFAIAGTACCAWAEDAASADNEPAAAAKSHEATPVRADTLPAVIAAFNGGARHVQTAVPLIASDIAIDLRGGTLELLPDAKTGVLLDCRGRGVVIRNGTLKTGPQRPCVYTSYNVRVVLSDVTIAPGSGSAMYARTGSTILATRVQASTIVGYFVYADDAAYVELNDCGVSEGSSGEAPLRFDGGRYRINGGTYSQQKWTQVKPNVLRGNAAPWPDGSPGGVAEHATFLGQTALGPLAGDDGGQMLGIERWQDVRRVETRPTAKDRSAYEAIRDRALQIVRDKRAAGASPAEIVRATADALLPERDAARVDVDRTLAVRAELLSNTNRSGVPKATYRFVDCTFEQVQLTSRSAGELVNCRIESGSAVPFSSSQSTYPWGTERALSDGEITRGLGGWTIRNATITGAGPLPMSLLAGVKFEACTFNGEPVKPRD